MAWDLGREDWRTFRIDRLSHLEPTGVRFRQRELPTPSAVEFVNRSISPQPQRYQARMTVDLPAAELERRTRSGWGDVKPIDERTCEYRTGDYDLRWLAMRVAMIGAEVAVHEPPELREEFLKLAGQATRAGGG